MPPPVALEVDRAGPNVDKTIAALNEQIKDRKNDELSHGVLVANREKVYLTTTAPHRDFAEDTAAKAGISRAVVQRLRRIGRLPPEVREILANTRIADRQDVLVELSDKIEGKPVEEAVAMARDFVDNPNGPRSTPKAAPAEPAEAVVEEPAPELGIVVFEGFLSLWPSLTAPAFTTWSWGASSATTVPAISASSSRSWWTVGISRSTISASVRSADRRSPVPGSLRSRPSSSRPRLAPGLLGRSLSSSCAPSSPSGTP